MVVAVIVLIVAMLGALLTSLLRSRRSQDRRHPRERTSTSTSCSDVNRQTRNDANAVRVEAMGRYVGFVSRQLAVSLSPALQRRCGACSKRAGSLAAGGTTEAATWAPRGSASGSPLAGSEGRVPNF